MHSALVLVLILTQLLGQTAGLWPNRYRRPNRNRQYWPRQTTVANWLYYLACGDDFYNPSNELCCGFRVYEDPNVIYGCCNDGTRLCYLKNGTFANGVMPRSEAVVQNSPFGLGGPGEGFLPSHRRTTTTPVNEDPVPWPIWRPYTMQPFLVNLAPEHLRQGSAPSISSNNNAVLPALIVPFYPNNNNNNNNGDNARTTPQEGDYFIDNDQDFAILEPTTVPTTSTTTTTTTTTRPMTTTMRWRRRTTFPSRLVFMTTPFVPFEVEPFQFREMCGQVDLASLRRIVPTLACCAQTVLYDTRSYNCTSSNREDAMPPFYPDENGDSSPVKKPQIVDDLVPSAAPPTFQRPAPAPAAQPPPQPPPLTSRAVYLPSDHIALTCQNRLFYIAPTIFAYYKCCGTEAFDYRTQTCQALINDNYAIQPKLGLPGSSPAFAIQLKCGETTYVFESIISAARFTC